MLRPPVNSGTVSVRREAPQAGAAGEQAASAVLARPAKPVSEIDGKNAARAAPMFAFAARSTCSAARMSGRRSRSSRRHAGRQVGDDACSARAAAAAAGSPGSGCADEQHERVLGLGAQPREPRDLGARGLRPAPRRCARRARSAARPRAGAASCRTTRPTRRERLLGERALLVERALAQVLRRDLADEREVRGALGLVGREVLLERRVA